MSGLPEEVGRFIERHALMRPGSRGVVAVSGGVDSLVLLDVLRTLGAWTLHVATLDHGLRGEAGAADADSVANLATHWGLAFTRGQVDVPALAAALSIGLEDAARRARYTFLVRVALVAGAQWIAVGHHAGDQAETVLMHLIRGSGLDGLRGMPPNGPLPEEVWLPDLAITCEPSLSSAPEKEWRGLRVVRPLLDVPREQIEAHAAARGLAPRQDVTNTDRAYLRNRMRHEIIPQLETINPNVRAALARLAGIVREDVTRLVAADEALLARLCAFDPAGEWARLDRSDWATLSQAEQRGVLRAAVRRFWPGLRDLGLDHVDGALALAAGGRIGAVAVLPDGLRLRVEPGALVLYHIQADPVSRIDAPALQPGQTVGPFVTGERITLACGEWTFGCRALEPGDDLELIHADPLAAALSVPIGAVGLLRTRLPGDRWQPRGLGGHAQALKAAWQSMKVPAGWRERVPLLVVEEQIAWFVVPEDGRALRGRVAQPFALPGETPTGRLNRAIIVVCWSRTTDL